MENQTKEAMSSLKSRKFSKKTYHNFTKKTCHKFSKKRNKGSPYWIEKEEPPLKLKKKKSNLILKIN